METGTVPTLFNVLRMGKWEPSLKISFSSNSGGDNMYIYIHRRAKVKGRQLERVAGLLTSYLRIGVLFVPELMQHSFLVLYGLFWLSWQLATILV